MPVPQLPAKYRSLAHAAPADRRNALRASCAAPAARSTGQA